MAGLTLLDSQKTLLQLTGSLKRPRTQDLFGVFSKSRITMGLHNNMQSLRLMVLQNAYTVIKQPDPLEILAGLGPGSESYNSVCQYALIVWSDRYWLRFLLASWNDRAQEAYGEKCYEGRRGGGAAEV